MKNCILVLLILTVIIFLFPLNTAAESVYNWEQLIDSTKFQLKQNKSDIILNYTLAVAYANTGDIEAAYNIIDVFGSSVSRAEFNTAVNPYLKKWYNYKDSNNLLLLNYAAFKEIINKNYQEAALLFEYIFEIDSDNLWAINHAAAALVEIKEYEQALTYANQALSMQENQYSHLIKGYAYYEQGNYVRAVLEAATARKLFKALATEEYQDFIE